MSQGWPLLIRCFFASVLIQTVWLPAYAQEFYNGKTLQLIVGTAPGGGFDTYTRTMARHIGKHIPGNPTTVVQNMPGAGNLIAANYIYNRAAPDGLTIGHFSGSMIFKHVLGDQGVMFDGKKFGWLGTPAPERHACVLTEKSGIRTLENWVAAKRPAKIGSLGPGNATSVLPQLLRSVLGLPINVIEGFKGTSDIRLSAESGEIDGACWGWDSIKVTWAKAVESGFVRPMIQTTIEPHPDLPNIPIAFQLAKTKEGQELLKLGYQAYGPSAIAYSVPPGLPPDRLLVLQKAFLATMKDGDFLAEMKKTNLVISPIDGPTISKIVGTLYSVEPGLLARFREITEMATSPK
jgi:tripartite-type tricarboxylate transporter receptor subunit TctC